MLSKNEISQIAEVLKESRSLMKPRCYNELVYNFEAWLGNNYTYFDHDKFLDEAGFYGLYSEDEDGEGEE